MAAPIQQFRNDLTKMHDQFSSVLPPQIKPEFFIRCVVTAVQGSPDLLKCDKGTLFKSCLKCAEDGLIPDGRQAALVKFRTKIDGNFVDAVQYMPMFAGLLRRVRNSGEVSKVQAHVIYEHDRFVWRQGTHEIIDHEPLFPGNRGEPVGAYSIATMKDGTELFEVMNMDDLNAVKKASKTSGFGPWKDWWSEMARKTAFKRLAKWLPLDAASHNLIDYDNDVDQGRTVHAPMHHQKAPSLEEAPPAAPPKQSSRLDALAAPSPNVDVQLKQEQAKEAVEVPAEETNGPPEGQFASIEDDF